MQSVLFLTIHGFNTVLVGIISPGDMQQYAAKPMKKSHQTKGQNQSPMNMLCTTYSLVYPFTAFS